MEATVVSQDLEEYDPEAKLQKDAEEGINIETMSLSGSDIDDDEDGDEGAPEESKNPEKKTIEEDILNLGADDTLIAENLGIDVKEGVVSSNEYSSDSDDDEVDYNDSLKKIDEDIFKDTLFTYHPETQQINYKELLTLSNVVRNKRGEIIDPLHKTIPFLTCYEKARILGTRN